MKARILSPDGYKITHLNRRKAIRERCFSCSGWSYQAIEACQHSDCPLFSFRSGKGKQSARERARAVRDYCKWCMAGKASEVVKCVSESCPLFAYRMTKVDRGIEITEYEPENRDVVNA
jgi:hypothetical protein